MRHVALGLMVAAFAATSLFTTAAQQVPPAGPVGNAAQCRGGAGPGWGRLARADWACHDYADKPVGPLASFKPVTDAMLRDPAAGDWAMWRRTYNSWGCSPLILVERFR